MVKFFRSVAAFIFGDARWTPAKPKSASAKAPKQSRPTRKSQARVLPQAPPLHRMPLWVAVNFIAATAPECLLSGSPRTVAAWNRVGEKIGAFCAASGWASRRDVRWRD